MKATRHKGGDHAAKRMHHHMKKAAEHHNKAATHHEQAKHILMKGETKGGKKGAKK